MKTMLLFVLVAILVLFIVGIVVSVRRKDKKGNICGGEYNVTVVGASNYVFATQKLNIYDRNEMKKGENVNEENVGYYFGFFSIIRM